MQKIEWSKSLYKKISDKAVRFCVENKISADQITLLNHFLTLAMGCFLFSRGIYLAGLGGLGVCLVNGFLDYLDGDVAKATGQESSFGEWIDSKFDVVIQNAIMGAIGIGCFKMGMPLIWIVMFYIGNSANNMVSFYYNLKFGFDSANGNELFRDYMDSNRFIWNIVMKNIIDPTASFYGLALITVRYWIAFGMIFDMMPICFMAITIIGNLRWVFMFVLYALHLKECNHFHILKALSILDEEREQFHELRRKV